MLQKLRPAGVIVAIFAFVVMSAGSAVSDDLSELKELRQLYHELKTDYDRSQKILDNREKHTRLDVEVARGAIKNLGRALDQLQQEIKNKDANAADAPKLKAKPGEQVTAVDNASDTEVSKPTGSPCDSYPKFTRPDTSAYQLPPFNEQSGTKRKLASQLLAAESALIEHSVECRPDWTSTSATNWASTREALVGRLLRLEIEYAMAFASGYSEDEDKLISEAYRNSPKLRNLSRQDRILYANYIKAKNLADAAVKKFRLAPDSATRLSLFDLQHRQKVARTAWRKVANEWTRLKGPEVEMLKQARAGRAERGIREMKTYHSGVDFKFHQAEQFLKTDSALLGRLLGKDGIKILEDEGGRRAKAGSKRN